MNMLRNKLHMASISLLLVGQLSACGGGDSGDTTGSTENPSPNPKVANAVADAGLDLDVSRNFTVILDGSASSDPDGDTLSYRWTQVDGPDVTGGTNTLDGVMPQFTAPETVSTLVFELRVNDGAGDSEPDMVHVNIMEDANVGLFVDGDTGSDDTGDGSRDNPYQTIAMALSQVSANQEDIYVMSRANLAPYDETAAVLQVPSGTSLYGGFDEQWIRDVEANLTRIDAYSTAIAFTNVDFDAWLSGFDIQTMNSNNASASVQGVVATNGMANLVISDNHITTGDVGFGESRTPGSNYGVFLSQLNNVYLQRSVITTGAAGHGAVGLQGNPGEDGSNGATGSGSGRASGGSGNAGYNGGAGGERGQNFASDCLSYMNGQAGSPGNGGALAGAGGAGGSGNSADPGSGGGNGLPGALGAAGAGGAGMGAMDGGFIAVAGARGRSGQAGGGGGGGGGGEASFWSQCGGGGGGGGEGGGGGQGGQGGQGGAASIGVWLDGIQGEIIISDSDILSGIGGDGNSGGLGGTGGRRGDGGNGGTGGGGNGGRGGNGGNGGAGGYGGAGAGGPSIGIMIGSSLAPTISDNVILSGRGGNGGNGGASANAGEGGWSYAVFDIDLDDGMVPVLLRNGLTAEEGGAPGDGLNAPAAGQSGRRNF